MRLHTRATRFQDSALRLIILALAGSFVLLPTPAASQKTATYQTHSTSELRDLVEVYSTDRDALLRRWNVAFSSARRDRMRSFYEQWQHDLQSLDYEGLSTEGRIDATLLKNCIRSELELLLRELTLRKDMDDLVPFADTVIELQEARHRFESVDAGSAATRLAGIPAVIEQMRTRLSDPSAAGMPSRIVALRTANWLQQLVEELENWYEHYAEFDPTFTWWTKQPARQSSESIREYADFLRKEVVGFTEDEDPPIVGDPIGADGLGADLQHEMIPYGAAELVEIANLEYAWCEREMRVASNELGYGDDWKAALEHVKTLHVAPGAQPELVRQLAHEAVDFLRKNDLLTIPPLAEEVWRMTMLSPERQKVAPFFLGGEVVQVSYPTSEMAHADKLMSMRGNNIHFSRAVVHHELIPGHHLQGFMTSRYNTHRRAFRTPFWTEGWALYWEMILWDKDFPQSAEDRVGMLFWRMHRAARIIFSLRFHLGTMTPQEAIDFLVDEVGHERASATAEVRRSFNGTYSPLYQAAYMLGGLQIRALHKELVGSGRMSNRAFHDAILQGGTMPIEMVRARLLSTAPPRDFQANWRFYGNTLDN